MKYFTSIFLSVLLYCNLFSQDISGLWVGSLYNDSTQQNYYYQLAISQNNGKYLGYSYTTFVVNGKTVIGIKSLKVIPQKSGFIFEDEELLFNNYPIAPPKGVKQITALSLSETDKVKILSGRFRTTRTKQYGRLVTGNVILGEKQELANDKLLIELEKLGLTKNLSFYKPATPLQKTPLTIKEVDYKNTKIDIKIVAPPTDPLLEIEKRKIETIQTIYFTADSITLQLFDNGFVDGDSVSLIVNGKIELEHLSLSTKAITKTIAAKGDSLKIIMYAENLGSIAPNTGLLIIYDGKIRHEIRFEGDLENNAAILLKRMR